MSRSFRFLAALGAAALWAAACGPMNVADPELTITFKPTSARLDQMIEVTVAAVDGQLKEGTGKVRLSSAAGSLKDGEEGTLAAGKAAFNFVCPASDAACKGTVRFTAEWTVDKKLVEASKSLSITTADAGAGGGAGGAGGGTAGAGGGTAGAGGGTAGTGGTDGGMDGGVPFDGGARLDAGVFDGGQAFDYRLWVVDAGKPTLLEGTLDSTTVVFQLTTNTTGRIPIADAGVVITVDQGATLSTGTLTTLNLNTDSQGLATATAYVGAAVRPFGVTATALDARLTYPVSVARVQSLTFKNDSMTRAIIATAPNGVNTSTPLFFELKDANMNPVSGVEVDFALNSGSPSDATVIPARDRANAMGVVRTTLNAGNGAGIASVRATLSAPGATLRADSIDVAIVSGKPNDDRLVVQCNKKTLGALQTQSPPITPALSMVCTIDYKDRSGNAPATAVAVSWLSEAGRFENVMQGAPGAGLATATFRASSLPAATTPLAGEPSNGSFNPRDNFVTIVAAIQGEEYFVDRAPADGGQPNGRWDPDEWFVDLGEPYVDANDNGQWDNGEPHLNTTQYDCATGMAIPDAQTTGWNGPNGCWNEDTLIWRTTHVIFTDNLVDSPSTQFLQFAPSLPSTLAPSTSYVGTFRWLDRYMNRLSNDSISMTVSTVVSGARGTASVMLQNQGEVYGHQIDYITYTARETSPGVFTNLGACDATTTTGPRTDTAVRCLRSYQIAAFNTAPTTGRLIITAPTAQSLQSDGGMPPPTNTLFEIRAGNSIQPSPAAYQFSMQFQ